MEKTVLVLDSQMLSGFQRCERYFAHSHYEHLEPAQGIGYLERGACFSEAIYEYYKAKISKKPFQECVMAGVNAIQAYQFTIAHEDIVDLRMLILQIFAQYCEYWRGEEIVPLACENEAGFSKILYEDDEHLFIYEGKPDWTGFSSWKDNTPHWMDHKSTVMWRSGLHTHSNQFLGYSWALNTKIGIINHVNFTKTMPAEKRFHRELIQFSREDIQDWVMNATQWYFRIAKTLREAKALSSEIDPINAFEKVRASCETKYGLCKYAKLCDTQSLVKIEQLKRLEYKQKDEVWKAWR